MNRTLGGELTWEEEGPSGWGVLVTDARARTPARRVEAVRPPLKRAALPEALPAGWLTMEEIDARREERNRLERNLVQEAMVTLRAMGMDVMQGEVEYVARIMWEQHSQNYCSEVAQQWGE